MSDVAMLEVVGLTAGYGRTDVLHDVSLRVPEGAIVGILGPNGAGKTTLMRSISGMTVIHGGRILFNGSDLRGRQPEDIVEAGIIHVPQGRKLFPEMTIADNLQLGAYRSAARASYRDSLRHVETYFPRLRERYAQRAGTLSGGEQQMLAIGRALMARPQLLILDEPSLGLAPIIVESIFAVLRQINSEGVTVLIAEQNAAKALEMSQTAYVIESGRIVHSGTGAELARSEVIRRSYLGVA
jgi:branched-chain amino acid transport system ATP-binding protein